MVDVEIPTTSDQFLLMLTAVLSTVVAILIAIPVFGLVVVPLGIFYFLIQVRCIEGGGGGFPCLHGEDLLTHNHAF